MKRDVKSFMTGTATYDTQTDFSPEQLRLIGAVAMEWNRLEYAFDFITADAIEVPLPIAHEVISRVNGFDGKKAIFELAIERLHDIPKKEFEETLAKIKECKGYREAVVHAEIVDAPSAIGRKPGRSGKAEHVLMSVKALTALFSFLAGVRHETAAMYFVYLEKRALDRLRSERGPDPEIRQAELKLEQAKARYLKDQHYRQSLPRLPQLPFLPGELQERGILPKPAKRT